jgi:hypothetical protein
MNYNHTEDLSPQGYYVTDEEATLINEKLKRVKELEEESKRLRMEVKDFLVEIAKSVEIIQTCGLVNTGVKIDISLPNNEFERAFNHFATKVPTKGGRPKSEFKINFSGVDIRFVRAS